MSSWAASILLALSSALGVSSVPERGINAWGGSKSWQNHGGSLRFDATSTEIPEKCSLNFDMVVHFPTVIQGAHEFYLDEKPVGRFGDPTFQSVESFYGKPQLSCRALAHGKELRWVVTSYSEYFARITEMPRVAPASRFHNFFAEGVHALVGGMLFVLGAFATIVSWKKVPTRMLAFFALATFSLPFYFICTTASFYGVRGEMFTLHRLADVSLWIGAIGIFGFLHEQRLVGKFLFRAFCVSAFTAILTLAVATNGDVAQVGTSVPFLVTPFVLVSALVNLWRFHKQGERLAHTLVKFSEIAFFVASAFSDILFILGLHQGFPVFSLGMLGILFFAAVSLEQVVSETYRERDYLRANLEQEVAFKTNSLAKALSDLKNAQAEIVASAKLASLGTLSAGIAHEINNSLNFVKGSLQPLSNILKKEVISEADRTKAEKLVRVMNDGLSLAAQIIVNLKTYTRATGTVSKETLRPLVENVLTMLHSKIQRLEVRIENAIPDDFVADVDKVCMTQVITNLVDNACDAMENQNGERRIRITAEHSGGGWALIVADNGPGIPEHIRAQIFDPFFTTKPEGKGTGLGLYIVSSEIAKRGGKIEVVSSAEKGTEMKLRFFREQQKEVA
jgi:signal transduction histidine kinase